MLPEQVSERRSNDHLIGVVIERFLNQVPCRLQAPHHVFACDLELDWLRDIGWIRSVTCFYVIHRVLEDRGQTRSNTHPLLYASQRQSLDVKAAHPRGGVLRVPA